MSDRVNKWQPILREGHVSLVFEEGLNDLRSCDAYRGITDNQFLHVLQFIHGSIKNSISWRHLLLLHILR